MVRWLASRIAGGALCSLAHQPDDLQAAQLRHLGIEHGHVDRLDSISSNASRPLWAETVCTPCGSSKPAHGLVPAFLLVGQQHGKPICMMHRTI